MHSPFDILDGIKPSSRPQTTREPDKNGQGTRVIFPPDWRERCGNNYPKRGEAKRRFVTNGLSAPEVEDKKDEEVHVPAPQGRVHLGFSQGLQEVQKKPAPKVKEVQPKPSTSRKPKKT